MASPSLFLLRMGGSSRPTQYHSHSKVQPVPPAVLPSLPPSDSMSHNADSSQIGFHLQAILDMPILELRSSTDASLIARTCTHLQAVGQGHVLVECLSMMTSKVTDYDTLLGADHTLPYDLRRCCNFSTQCLSSHGAIAKKICNMWRHLAVSTQRAQSKKTHAQFHREQDRTYGAIGTTKYRCYMGDKYKEMQDYCPGLEILMATIPKQVEKLQLGVARFMKKYVEEHSTLKAYKDRFATWSQGASPSPGKSLAAHFSRLY